MRLIERCIENLYTVFHLTGTRLRVIEKNDDYFDDYLIHLLIGIGKKYSKVFPSDEKKRAF